LTTRGEKPRASKKGGRGGASPEKISAGGRNKKEKTNTKKRGGQSNLKQLLPKKKGHSLERKGKLMIIE